jgi:protein phosphatase
VQENTEVQKCAEGLGQLALDNGSRDNVSCIVIEVAEAA